MAGVLTVSGNEITDAIRNTGTQGDGLAAPAGVGIYEPTTNLCPNGGFETNATGYSPVGANTIAQSSAQAKFGTKSALCTYGNGVAGDGNVGAFAITFSGAGTWTISAWVYVPTGYDGSAGPCVRFEGFTGASGEVHLDADLSKRDQWQKVQTKIDVVGGDLVGSGVLRFPSLSANVPSNGKFVYFDGVQVEQKPFATPYVETNGATASRAAARVQAPASLLNATQAGFVFRIAYGFPSTATRANPCYLLDLRDDASNLLGLWLDTANKWNAGRLAAGVGAPAQSAAQTFATDDAATIAFACDSGHVKVSINGGAFTPVANTSIPALAAALADLGSQAVTSQANMCIKWAALLTGTLTDADAASFYASGDTAPAPATLPAAVQLTAVMPMLSPAYTTPGDWQATDIGHLVQALA